jgi:prepilin-type processing-associated H-X9-DG protein
MDHPISPPAQTSLKAIWSLILGILGLLCPMLIPAIVAVVLGHKALGQIRRSNGSLGGGGLAVGGLVTGYIGILFGIICVLSMMAALIFPALSAARAKAQEAASSSSMSMVFQGCRMYALDHNGQLPMNLDLDEYLGGPQENSFADDCVLLFPGRNLADIPDPSTTVILEYRVAGKGRVVAYADGHVEGWPGGQIDYPPAVTFDLPAELEEP